MSTKSTAGIYRTGNTMEERLERALKALETAGVAFLPPAPAHGRTGRTRAFLTCEEKLIAAETQLAKATGAKSGRTGGRIDFKRAQAATVKVLRDRAASEPDLQERAKLSALADQAERGQVPRIAAAAVPFTEFVTAYKEVAPGQFLDPAVKGVRASSAAVPRNSQSDESDVSAMFAKARAESDPCLRGALFRQASKALTSQSLARLKPRAVAPSAAAPSKSQSDGSDVSAMFAKARAESDPCLRGALFRQASQALASQSNKSKK